MVRKPWQTAPESREELDDEALAVLFGYWRSDWELGGYTKPVRNILPDTVRVCGGGSLLRETLTSWTAFSPPGSVSHVNFDEMREVVSGMFPKACARDDLVPVLFKLICCAATGGVFVDAGVLCLMPLQFWGHGYLKDCGFFVHAGSEPNDWMFMASEGSGEAAEIVGKIAASESEIVAGGPAAVRGILLDEMRGGSLKNMKIVYASEKYHAGPGVFGSGPAAARGVGRFFFKRIFLEGMPVVRLSERGGEKSKANAILKAFR
jgi:hypothetical protein